MAKGIMRLGVLATALALAACAGNKDKADAVAVTELASSDVATAVRESIGEAVVVTGTLAPYRTAEVRAQVPGVLTGLRVDRGSRVSAGDVMAALQAEGVRSQALGAKAAVAAAQASVALALRQLESSKKLRAAGAMSDFDLQAAQTGYEAAQAQLAAARAGEAAAGEAARRANVSAPIDGAVSNRQANEGEAVNPGAVLFTIVDARYLELEGRVPAEDASRVRVGMPVEFTLDSYAGRTFRGQVTRLEPTADAATRQVGVYVRLPNTDYGIVGGLYATGRILTGKSHTGVLLPLSALRGSGQDAYVWAIRGGKAVKQAVQVGTRDEARGSVEVLSGVSAGEIVVSAPGDLNEGATVRVAAPGGVSPAERAAPAQSAQATNAGR